MCLLFVYLFGFFFKQYQISFLNGYHIKKGKRRKAARNSQSQLQNSLKSFHVWNRTFVVCNISPLSAGIGLNILTDIFWKYPMYSFPLTKTSRANMLFTSEVCYLQLWEQKKLKSQREVQVGTFWDSSCQISLPPGKRFATEFISVSVRLPKMLPSSHLHRFSNSFLRLFPRLGVWMQVNCVQRANFPDYSDFT